MGRRKERRLAAKGAAGRRVKLDLFAEPSGVLGGQNEVEGDDDDTKNQLGLSNSPSSSGKQPENPLALLGQYSDDELDGHSSGSSGGQSRAAVQDLTVPQMAQQSTEHEIDSSGMKEVNGYSSLEGEQLEMPSSPASMEMVEKREDSHPTEGYVTSSTVMLAESDMSKRSPATVDAQDAQGVILGWKMVLHEESNQYYYWNVTSGETSWEIPDILAQETDSTWGRKDSALTESMEMAKDVEKPNHCAGELLADDKAGGILVQNGLYGSFPFIKEQHHAASSYESNAMTMTTETEDDALGEKYLQSELLKNYEQLFEKLKSFRAKCNLHGHDQMLKCLWELETRLTDIKSLTSCDYSLLPYWEYCKGRFLHLEAAVDDVLQCSKCKELNEVHVTHETSGNSSDDMVENLSHKNEVSVLGDFNLSESAGELKVATDCAKVQTGGATVNEHVPSHEKSTPCYGDFSKEKNESNRIAKHSESTSTNVLHSAEDVDMDVDMEVEDIAPSSKSIIEVPSVASHVPLEQLNQSNLTAIYEPSAQEHRFSIPPAPDDDWIPPPPPDSEPIPPPPPDSEPIPPPPPPDEHPESILSQLSGLAATQSYSYPGQFSYSNPHFEVYGQADAVAPNSSLFSNGEAYQPTISHPPLYYEALAVSYSPATFAVNPVPPSVYIGVQDGALPPALEASGFHSNSIYNTSNAIDAHSVGSAALLINSVVSTSSSTSEVTGTLVEIPLSEAPSQQSATTVATEGVHVPSVPLVTTSVAASATTIKGQSKVLRSKKRTISAVSSLRSNKKVSSLVDKWKAAKEELKEEEKEPKSAYEILEMKRQREIEEWRAQQIASGEAKDNANFQPLGGDWRERVKRRRAQLAKESGETSTDGEGKQPPKLDELSNGLPPGWQVYWDDSSKQVYYGNSVTSETTWIRPTK